MECHTQDVSQKFSVDAVKCLFDVDKADCQRGLERIALLTDVLIIKINQYYSHLLAQKMNTGGVQ